MDITQFVHDFDKEVADEQDRVEQEILRGAAGDYTQYKALARQRETLQRVRSILGEHYRRYQNDEDEDD